MKLLFVCNQNQNRSKTAEILFKDSFETRSAGLYNSKPLTKAQLLWADAVVVMGDEPRREISLRFPKEYLKKQILSLDIQDNYYYMQPELINQLKKKMKELI